MNTNHTPTEYKGYTMTRDPNGKAGGKVTITRVRDGKVLAQRASFTAAIATIDAVIRWPKGRA